MTFSERDKDEIISTQNEIIKILFEIIKRFQMNNELDEEYFQIITSKDLQTDRLEEIMKKREENSIAVNNLLKQLETGV